MKILRNGKAAMDKGVQGVQTDHPEAPIKHCLQTNNLRDGINVSLSLGSLKFH